ncbi:MAG: hypothetical protein IPG95_14770 [Saprospiraceae bacterium]|nr:hypothetical protein [Saprospiraceae bacterium]
MQNLRLKEPDKEEDVYESKRKLRKSIEVLTEDSERENSVSEESGNKQIVG